MKRLLLSVVIASTLGLTACGGKSSNDHKDDAVPTVPQAHLAFQPDPSATDTAIPLPSDILFSGTKDGSLSIPDKTPENLTDPNFSIGALDGWSTTESITIPVNFPKYDSQQNPVTDLGILPQSVTQDGTVRLFAVQKRGPLAFDKQCATTNPNDSLLICRVEQELKYGVDFTTQVVGNQIVIVPLKPLKQNQSYLYAITNKVLDTYDRPIAASATFNVLKSDASLPSPDQQALQAAVHSYDEGLENNGVDPQTVIYSSMFTTQSISNVLDIAKAKMAADYAQGFPNGHRDDTKFGLYAPQLVQLGTLDGTTPKYVEPVLDENGKQKSAADIVNLGPDSEDSIQYQILSDALLYHAKIKLPIYSACSSTKCLKADGKTFDIDGRWKAAGDSPLAVLSAVQSGTLPQADFLKQASDQGVNPQDALSNPSLLVGRHFTLPDGSPVDPYKLLTRYNPLPALQTKLNAEGIVVPVYETVDVQITIPRDINNPIDNGEPDNPLRYEIPDTGYQVSIGMHGIGTVRQTSLAYAGTFAANFPASLAGLLKLQGLQVQDKTPVATISIDMPLHGERSFRVADSGPYDVTATEGDDSLGRLGLNLATYAKGDVLNFVRIQSPLTIRSNFRQAAMDQIALRLLIPEISKNLLTANPEWYAKADAGLLKEGVFNTDQVTVAGLSLGAMISTSFTALANSGFVDASGQPVAQNPYQIKGVSLMSPAGSLAGAFAGSANFGPALFKSITETPIFQAQAKAAAKAQGIDPNDNPQGYAQVVRKVYQQFIPPFGFAVQTAIDAIDPVNFATIIKDLNSSEDVNKHVSVHLVEIVGDKDQGGSNPSDQVLPNRFNGLPIGGGEVLPLQGYPIAGTEPLIDALGIPCASPVAGTPVQGSGAVRFLKGQHSSFIDPSAATGLDSDTAVLVTEDMQAMASVFASSAGKGQPEIETAKDGLIQTCPSE
ncbi:lipase [Shewanella sp. 202IG2-18]|uniref:VolA/Pla-1 family phospholipase n=1 Tax=Parashewanella hymeniacidonis TaxID=2807618 RepID=UPI00196167D8|nr:VolA/Pla-1 family phospholipase [Parashewanella hymeniacidonis]MBM7070558.1 lipase [Parashewanella hymeniacidonis]